MRLQFQGLTKAEAEESRKKYGSNALSPSKIEGFWDKLRDNLKDPIIIILSVALVLILGLSFLGMTEWYEAVAIGAAVVLATFVSTFSEYKNETSFQKLQEEASKIQANVLRDGHVIQLPVSDVVKGDYVLLQAGDKAPADGYIISGEVKVNQASLTGEAEAVEKRAVGPDDQPENKDLANHFSVFRGSVIEDGEAVLIIESVGDNTFYGVLSKELAESDDRLSPLQLKLKGLAELISKFGYIAAILIFVTFMFQKSVIAHDFDMNSIVSYFGNWQVLVSDLLSAGVLAIIIVVAAVPEGLPMMIAIVLSLNMRKLLSEKVLVRKLLGIETAGSINLLFSDKTGTITRGRLEAKLFITGAGNIYQGYQSIPTNSRSLVSFSITENSASFVSPAGEIVGGNVSEKALLMFVQSDNHESDYDSELLKEVLFNSERKFSASQVRSDFIPEGFKSNQLTLIKGAPEVILNICDHFHHEEGKIEVFNNKKEVNEKLDELADSGMRLIALAVSESELKDHALPDDAVLVGLIGIRDEIRSESHASIETMHDAGVQVVMITGDRLETAKSIAKEVGLLTKDDDVILTHAELKAMSDDEIKAILPQLKVIARALPSDKSRMVRISKSVGKVVGMTGDGVNDSAALKQSDVGFAMGSGSEVSKEAGDIVILDDNFHSISNAIRYGRTIFKSIRKFIVFQLTVNVAAVTTAFLGPLFGIDFPLTIIQLLWINMIMDTLAAIAFGGEPALDRYMEEPPVDREAHILTKNMGSSILTSGLFITAFSIFFLSYGPFRELFLRNGMPDESVFLTVFFNIFIFMILINAFNVRTENINLFENLKQNPGFLRVMLMIFGLQIVFTYIGGTILRTTPLTLQEWMYVLGFALLIIPVDLIRKTVFFRHGKLKTA
ncbi:MAG: calcium-translocating P-type ATPase, PMCA-type [Cyclobacteriaceae bacterium]